MNQWRNQFASVLGVAALVGIIGLFTMRSSHGAGGAVAVQISNPVSAPAETQDVDNPAQQPFQYLAQPDTYGTGLSQATTEILVPAHKRLVIEYVSAALGTGSGSVTMETTSGGTRAAYYFIENTSTHTHQFFPAHIYADPGTSVQVSVTSSNGQRVYADVEISGHYVNVP